MKRESLLMFFAFALSSVLANTGTVTAELSADGTAFNVTFANHANETNSLRVVYGASDRGEGTNGWEQVERLGTVYPSTASWEYAVPSGWGGAVKAIRFILSEVPYDYDYSTTCTVADQVPTGASSIAQCIMIENDANFTLLGSDRVCVEFSLNKIADGHNQTIFCARNSSSTSPYMFLFWQKGQFAFAWDYDSKRYASAQKYTDANQIISMEVDYSGIYLVDGNGSRTAIKTTDLASPFSVSPTGPLLLFAGQGGSDAPSNPSCIKMYAFRVYGADGNIKLDLIPMVKGGKAGLYDRVNNRSYTATIRTAAYRELDAGSRIESDNPFFASAICRVATVGPTVFTPATAMSDATAFTNSYGGVLDGMATLTLTGANDWGGAFDISNGTLVAAFGQGLASTDCLRLDSSQATSGTLGGYGGWEGKATATVGSGAGQIYVPSGGYLVYCAADGGELEVDIGGAGAVWTASDALRRLLLNGAAGAGTLTFKNPISVPAKQTLIIRTGFGRAVFPGDIVSEATDASGATVSTYDLGNSKIDDDGVTVLGGTANRFKTLQVECGTLMLGDGSSMTLDGNFIVRGSARFIATNATVTMTGNASYLSGLTVNSGSAEFYGGEFTASQIILGETSPSAEASAVFDGKVMLSENINPGAFGSMTINAGCASQALVVNGRADVSMVNLNFLRRNIYQYGGAMMLRGNYGVNNMGQGGAARYVLQGGTLTAACVSQSSPTESTPEPKAWFVLAGGTLVTRANVKPVFFQNFTGESSVQVAGSLGGTFQVDYATSVTNGIVISAVNSNTWNYGPEDYLTAPAFRKTGAATLTLSGASSYRCATEIAAGTLALASGDNPGVLPVTGVLRLTGGTLDLGGNAQTVKALAGTAGAVQNGTLTVTDGIYPGGHGAAGSFTCGASLAGTLHVDVEAAGGACDKIIASGVLDLSGIDFVLPDEIPSGVTKLRVIEGATTGSFKSVTGMPAAWAVVASANDVSVKKVVGTMLSVR